MINGVLFDLDGTLLNTLPDLAFIANQTLREFGYPERSMEEIRTRVGYGVRRLIERALPEGTALTEEIYERMQENYLKYQNQRALKYEGIDEMLHELKALGVKTAIVTNKPDAAAQVVSEKYFGELIGFTTGERKEFHRKPHPDLCNLAFETLGLTAEECIYVGDADTDLETGDNAGMETLSCVWGFRGEEFLRAHGAKHIIHTPEEILDYVKAQENNHMEHILGTVTGLLTDKVREILKDNLTGIYLHGSAVMGCFNPVKSDIDVIIAVNHAMTNETKRELMDCIVALNALAPDKGLEMSVVLKSVCDPFVYPTPFELHFSPVHLNWYRNHPDEYIEKMNGTDKDLAAHFTVIRHRGKCLTGAPVEQVFGTVPRECYMDSIWEDVRNAEADIQEDTTYLVLNLARVLAFKKEGLVLSKREGGEWALDHLPVRYRELIGAALADYEDEYDQDYGSEYLKEYAGYMLEQIQR